MPNENLKPGNNEEGKKREFKAAVVNIDQLVESQARDIGDGKMTESKEDRSKGWLSRNWNRIWKHNLMQEYFRQKEISKARKDIVESQNLYKGEENPHSVSDTSAHKEAMDSIITRFTSEYEDDMLRKEEADSKKAGTESVNNDIKKIIKSYAGGHLSADAFNREKNLILKGYNPEYAKEKSLYADNLLDIANEVKQAVENGEKLEDMDFDIKLTLGKARESLNTEAKKTAFDKFLNNKFMANTKFGHTLTHSAVVTAGFAAGYAITTKVFGGAAKKAAKWAGFGVGLAAAGAFEAAKESARLNRERGQHMRESAKGMSFEDDEKKRREQMDKNRYETKGATEIISNLKTDLEKVKTGNVSDAELNAIFDRVSDVESRIKLGHGENIDLISYEKGNVEKDRTLMVQELAELKVALKNSAMSNVATLMNGKTFEDYLTKLTSVKIGLLIEGEGGIAQKDRVFKKLKREKCARKFVQTMLVGGAMSFVVDEVKSLFTNQDGLIEGTFKSLKEHLPNGAVKATIDEHVDGLHQKATSLEALRRYIFNENPGIPDGAMHEEIFGSAHIRLPEGVNLVANSDGTYRMISEGHVIGDRIEFNSDGSFTDESKALLEHNGVTLDPHPIESMEQRTVSTEEYIKNHPGMEEIHRHEWMNNDTKPFDQNELRGYWGGNNGMSPDGKNYVLDLSHMTSDGSFHNGQHIDPQALMKAGLLKMKFSYSDATQGMGYPFDVTADGKVLIPVDSEAGKTMFNVVNGHANFLGRFGEVMTDKNDIVATMEGKGMDEIVDTVKTNVLETTVHIPGVTDYEPPIPTPFIPRRPMGKAFYGKDGKEQKEAGDKKAGAILEKKADSVVVEFPDGWHADGLEGFDGKEIDPVEYDDVRSDLEMINRSVNEGSKIGESGFKSEYGKALYAKLRGTQSKDFFLNKDMIKETGNGLEKYLGTVNSGLKFAAMEASISWLQKKAVEAKMEKDVEREVQIKKQIEIRKKLIEEHKEGLKDLKSQLKEVERIGATKDVAKDIEKLKEKIKKFEETDYRDDLKKGVKESYIIDEDEEEKAKIEKEIAKAKAKADKAATMKKFDAKDYDTENDTVKEMKKLKKKLKEAEKSSSEETVLRIEKQIKKLEKFQEKEEAIDEETAILEEGKKFAEDHPGEMIPEEVVDRLKKAQAKVKELEEEYENM